MFEMARDIAAVAGRQLPMSTGASSAAGSALKLPDAEGSRARCRPERQPL